MSLTSEQIAEAVIRDCRRHRLANHKIRQRCSELVGRWLRRTPWFLVQYPEYEDQTKLYQEIRAQVFRLTQPKRSHRKSANPKPANDPRNLSLFLPMPPTKTSR